MTWHQKRGWVTLLLGVAAVAFIIADIQGYSVWPAVICTIGFVAGVTSMIRHGGER